MIQYDRICCLNGEVFMQKGEARGLLEFEVQLLKLTVDLTEEPLTGTKQIGQN